MVKESGNKPKRRLSGLKKKGNKTVKTVVLKKQHSKPYRKRHISILAVLLIAGALLIAILIQYSIHLSQGATSANGFVGDLFNKPVDNNLKINSTYGFNVTFDQRKFYGNAIDTTRGDLLSGNNLTETRAYSTIKVSPSSIDNRTSLSSLMLTYHYDTSYKDSSASSLESIESLAFKDSLASQDMFTKSNPIMTKISGVDFRKTNWTLKENSTDTLRIKPVIQTYAGVVNDHAVTIVINYGLGTTTDDSLYSEILTSIKFGPQEQASISPTPELSLAMKNSRSLMDKLLFSDIASAESNKVAVGVSEKIAATYSPAVFKIYNAYKLDLTIDNKFTFPNIIDGGTGSGFVIGQDGYIATNGHVASIDLKGMAIRYSLIAASKGVRAPLLYLQGLAESHAGLSESDFQGKTDEEAFAMDVDAVYGLDDSIFKTSNMTADLLVGLDEKGPDATQVIKDLNAGIAFKETDNIKTAKLVASEYREFSGGSLGFKTSDVAILKIDGSNYPVTKLGDVSKAVQGADLMILGYPGNANDNGIVDATSSKVTLTTGKVSSIKDAAGSKNKLIETDTTIGHGNSGGPAMVDDGSVIGIATYTSDGSGSGGAVYNYIRDIADLKQLVKDSSVVLDTNSKTQKEWEKGLEYFYNSHYSQAIKNFATVKELYPLQTRVQEFIDAANVRIANGEDVKDFPILWVSGAAAIILAGIGFAVVIIIRHKKRHNIYKAGVSQSSIQPVVTGNYPQPVTVAPPAVTPVEHTAATINQTPTPETPNPGPSPQQAMPPSASTPTPVVPSEPVSQQPTQSNSWFDPGSDQTKQP